MKEIVELLQIKANVVVVLEVNDIYRLQVTYTKYSQKVWKLLLLVCTAKSFLTCCEYFRHITHHRTSLVTSMIYSQGMEILQLVVTCQRLVSTLVRSTYPDAAARLVTQRLMSHVLQELRRVAADT